ncbi:fusaric acid resistance protein [Acinetobacter sp. ANC 4169]|uniref:FUSC family protein n=1 Tax=Acinetobacter sp. ANC 4169 TaxID=1977879 RepID=UPI000A3586A1|nr:FUSC family protein [Acinetobacter sp. ANC 4169]OTG72757.1 fusaric acid resistance protein [Acinetobacter sp. ANC 4169]
MLLTKQILAFRPSKMDWIFAIKTFLAGMLALYVAFALNLAYPIWAIGTVFVIANPFSGMTSSKSLYRALGTLLGAVVSVVVTPLLINTPWLFTLFLAAWVGGCLYISMLDRTPRSYVFMLAGYTTVIISYNIIYNIDTTSMFDMAVGRFLEIMVGVVCSAIVTTTIFPLHIGPAVASKVSKTFKDTKDLFDQILLNPSKLENYSSALSQIARDIAEIHVMAVHLAYEKSTLQGMTKPLQEMLHQLSMLVANLVAMAERIKQLDQIDSQYRAQLQAIHDHSAAFLKDDQDIQEQTLNLLPDNFEQDFTDLMAAAPAEQQVILASLKMDIRHFIQNIRAIKLIWQRIQQGDASLPESVTPLTTTYPNLHRDHGVAVRGGISAFMVVIIATGFWILSGWKAGFMMAEMAAISACILTAMDNPVPALKMFVRGNIYAGLMVFIYAYGIFPHVSSFWELALVLAPFVIYCLMMFPHPPLTGIALPALMGTIMGLNLQNRYTLDQVFFFDATIGSVLGPIISIYIIHLVRAMSPEITVQRILSLHYKAIRQALYIPYGVQFRIHLRSMLDRIGVLNTKMVQSEKLKTQINLALVETSAVIDLTRLQELMHRLDSDQAIVANLEDLQQRLDDYFRAKENAQNQLLPELHQQVILKIGTLKKEAQQLDHTEISQRIQMSLNNIRSSLCHETAQSNEYTAIGEVAHG